MALEDERVLNKMAKRFEKQHIKRLEKGKCDTASGVAFVEALGELEKIGDQFTNIAERAPDIQRHHIELSG
jgi:phosphate:Na+ symporter